MCRGVAVFVLILLLVPTVARAERIAPGVWEVELSGSAGKETFKDGDTNLGTVTWATLEPEVGYYITSLLQARLVTGVFRQVIEDEDPTTDSPNSRQLSFLLLGEVVIAAPNDSGVLPYLAIGAGTVLRKNFENTENENTSLVPSLEIGLKMFPFDQASVNLGLNWTSIENSGGVKDTSSNYLDAHLGISIYLGREGSS